VKKVKVELCCSFFFFNFLLGATLLKRETNLNYSHQLPGIENVHISMALANYQEEEERQKNEQAQELHEVMQSMQSMKLFLSG